MAVRWLALGAVLLAGCAEVGATGTWSGHLESFELPSGSDAIRIEIEEGPGGEITGVVVFGDAPPPPTPTDPDLGFPQGWTLTERVEEGFRYTIVSGLREGDRVRVAIDARQLWADWCPLQTPFPLSTSPGSGFSCVPNLGFSVRDMDCRLGPDPETGVEEPIDCTKLDLCLHAQVCLCEESGCFVAPGVDEIVFDLTRDAEGTLSGSVRGIAGTIRTYLRR